MREVDRRAREEFGIPELILMEHTGYAAARAARRIYARSRGRGAVLILSGSGANGGDGFVAARHLDNWEVPVRVVLIGELERVRGAAQVNLEVLQRLRVPLELVSSLRQWRGWASRAGQVSVILDALLGTGVSGAVREPIRTVIGWINRQRKPVVSVDLPSGLCADSGRPCGVAVRALLTVTCGLPKRGLCCAEGREWAGRVEVADISLPRALRPCSS